MSKRGDEHEGVMSLMVRAMLVPLQEVASEWEDSNIYQC